MSTTAAGEAAKAVAAISATRGDHLVATTQPSAAVPATSTVDVKDLVAGGRRRVEQPRQQRAERGVLERLRQRGKGGHRRQIVGDVERDADPRVHPGARPQQHVGDNGQEADGELDRRRPAPSGRFPRHRAPPHAEPGCAVPGKAGIRWIWVVRRPVRRSVRRLDPRYMPGESVETMGLEPTTPCLQSRCSSQLSYVPEWGVVRIAAGLRGPLVSRP